MSLNQDEFDFIRGLVQEQSAIVLERDKVYLAETRLSALARREGFGSVNDIVAHLRFRPDNGLKCKVLEAMATTETSFFRDCHPFESLRQVVIPELLRQRAAQRCLYIWSGACSSGQEPYSLAMLLLDSFPALAGWTVRILATDMSNEMLDRARQGVYSQLEVSRGLPARLLARFFQQQGTEWRIHEEVRRLVEFRPMNLIGPWPALPYLDMVLLRNVLIYFDLPTKKMILTKIGQVLRPGGYLFLGGAETTLNIDDRFERIQFERSSYYRLRGLPGQPASVADNVISGRL
jgi:chemotaxis protein methyltransferase CheR